MIMIIRIQLSFASNGQYFKDSFRVCIRKGAACVWKVKREEGHKLFIPVNCGGCGPNSAQHGSVPAVCTGLNGLAKSVCRRGPGPGC